jgi:hypothetical protein
LRAFSFGELNNVSAKGLLSSAALIFIEDDRALPIPHEFSASSFSCQWCMDKHLFHDCSRLTDQISNVRIGDHLTFIKGNSDSCQLAVLCLTIKK